MKNTKVNFVNLTPHKITLRGKSDQIIEPSGKVARVESKEYSLGATANGVPIVSRDFEDVQGLPNPRNFAWTAAETEGTGSPRIAKPGELAEITIYIVSAIVLSAVPHRRDVAAPDTGETAIRNEQGHIVAVTRLIMNPTAVVEDEDCAF